VVLVLALLLVFLAIGGGIAIHPLLFLLLVFAVILALTGRRGAAL
jgi:hypothetical protein